MSWLVDRLNSSIGKKFIMAITGLSLIIFLVIHLLNNLLLFGGPEIFNKNVEQLDSIKPIIRIIEVILLLIFSFHIYNSLKLYFENKRANPQKYVVNVSSENSTFYSRYMTLTGLIILAFLIFHLSTFWVSFNFGGHSKPFFDIVKDAFSNPFISIFYFVSMIFLGIHLNHAFQSAFQSLGWRHKKYTPIIEKIGTVIALIMLIGFASIPLFFYLGLLGGK